MRIKAYIDTNIFIYAIIHHPTYGKVCARILGDLQNGVYEGYGSLMVAIELLGSLSKIDPKVARRAVELYFALNMRLLPLNEEVLTLASLLNEILNLRYDAIHAAAMMLNEVPIIITNDLDNWIKLSRNYAQVLEEVKNRGFNIKLSKLNVVSPATYSLSLKGSRS